MPRSTIPKTGRAHDQIMAELDAGMADDADFRGGRTFSLVYWAGDHHHKLVAAAHDRYVAHNALNPMAFPGLKQMENQVVAMSASLLNAPAQAAGTMSSGGTESILLAVKTWRDRARKRRPWVRRPNLVGPATIHPAFAKAGHLFDVALHLVPTDTDGIFDPDRLAARVDRNTVMAVCSAPQYVHGVVDPIPQVADRMVARGVPLHVDACFGGFIQPWLERLGVEMPVWDFRVPGVMSISADLHKFGYTAKGASVLLYRDVSTLRHQFFVSTDWAGGLYASPGLAGTRPGGPIAAAWASLQGMGQDGYLDRARVALDAVNRLRAGIRQIPELRLLGRPHSVIATWAAAEDGQGRRAVDIYAVADLLHAKGWSVDRQQRPPSMHNTVTAANAPVIDAYLDDLRASVAAVRADPSLSRSGEAAVYGTMARVPLRGLVKRNVLDMMEKMYGPQGEMPDLSGDGGGIAPWQQRLLDATEPLLDATRRLRTRLGTRIGRGVR
ncbi:MAG: aspartate aminotransferase family protein [Oligoflexia bacterium]|nr:aspartate aminotransferase family protein [Oligoflexia bacterium]